MQQNPLIYLQMFDVVLIGKRYAHLYNKNVTIISFDQLVLIYMHHRIYMHQSALYISLFFFVLFFFLALTL